MDPKKTTEPAETTPPNDYDAMSSAFDSLMEPSPPEGDSALAPNEGAAPAAAAEGTPATPAAEGTPATPAAEGTPATPAAEGTTSTPAAEGTTSTPAAKGTTSTEDVDWKKRFEDLEAKVTAQQPAEPTAVQPPEPEKPPVDAPPLYAKDEQDFLTQYAKDWPDVARGEALTRRAEYQQLVSHVFSEIQRVWGPLVQQGAQAAETVADSTTLQAIREVHKDYDDPMYEAVVEYANGLSGMPKRVALATIEEGEVSDVIDLISEYKRAKGLDKPKVVAGTGVPTSATSVTELPAAAKKAAKALGVVDSKRTATSTATDPNDFDSAWDEAVSSK